MSFSFSFKTRCLIQESTNPRDQSHRLLAGPRLKPEQALYGFSPSKWAPEGIESEIFGGANTKILSQPLG